MAIKEAKKWTAGETIKSRITGEEIEVKLVSPNSYYPIAGDKNWVPKSKAK